MSGITIAVLLVAVGVGTCVIAAMLLYAGAHSLGYTYRKAGPGEWRSDLDATEALTGMIDTTTPTVTMTRRRRANQPGVLVQRALFFLRRAHAERDHAQPPGTAPGQTVLSWPSGGADLAAPPLGHGSTVAAGTTRSVSAPTTRAPRRN